MARHRFSRIDDQTLGMVTKSAFDCNRFRLVAQRCRCAVCIEVVYILRIELGVTQCVGHATRRTFAVFAGSSHVVSVSTHAEACQFPVNTGAAGLSMFVLFQNHYASTFPQNEPVPILVPWTTRRFWIVI